MIISSASTFKRIEDFLKKDQFEDHRVLLQGGLSLLDDAEGAIKLQDVVLDIKSDVEPTPASLTIHKGSITLLSGPVGCGKSTLLKAILGEVHPKSGRISISTPYIGYCSQVPWLQNTTLKKNIIGTAAFEEVWYQRVIDDCNLGPDIAQLPDGDETLLGSRGISVSGGQKHRIVRIVKNATVHC
jgi:ABC-type bacteriocin/lantibiotic exporter with double-glycine peptidase domain